MDYKEIQIIVATRKALVVGNSQFRSVTDFRTTAEDLEKSYRELTEREDVKRNCLRKLKRRLERDQDILYRTDESYLMCYLRFAKFDCDRAYDRIRKLYSLRMNNSKIFSLPSNLETLLRYGFATFLPYKDQEGRIISILDFRKWDTDKMSFCEVLAMISTIHDIILINPHTQISGVVRIFDFRGLTLSQLVQIFRPSMNRCAARIFQECYPLRSKIVLAIYCGPILSAALFVLRCLIEEHNLDRLKFIGSDMTELHQYVNPAVLPKEYGGSLEENEFSTTDLIMDNLPYLKYDRSFGQKSICKLHPTIELSNI